MQSCLRQTDMWPCTPARRVRPGVLVWVATFFVGVTMALNRQFAYIYTGHLYISELVLAFLLAGSILSGLRERPWRIAWDSPAVPIGFFLLAGTISLVRGAGEYGYAAWKDSVLCYYAVAFFVGQSAFRSRHQIWMVFSAIALGGVLATGLVIVNLMPGGNDWVLSAMPRRVAVATNLAMELSVILCACLGPLLPRRLRRAWLLLSVLQVGLIVVGRVRTAWASLAVAVLLLGVLRWGRWRPILDLRSTVLRTLKWAALIVTMVWLLWPAMPAKIQGPIKSIWWEGLSSFARPAEQVSSYENGRWRIVLWRSAADVILRHPLCGIPFGKVFVPQRVAQAGYKYSTQEDNEVHNSLISVALRMGLLGLAFFLWALWRVMKGVYRWGRESLAEGDYRLAAATFAVLTLILSHGLFCVALEGPYMGLPFWLMVGMGTALSRMRPAPNDVST